MRRGRGGLEDRRELERATLDVLGSCDGPLPLLLLLLLLLLTSVLWEPWERSRVLVCGCLPGLAKFRVANPRLRRVAASCDLDVSLGTLTSSISTGVISEGSTRGIGRPLSRAFDTMPCHWGGSPTYFCSWWSKPVCTRCSKLLGAEICTFLFFFLNMLSQERESGCAVCVT